MTASRINLRLLLVCMMATAVALPIAIVSVAKVLLLLFLAAALITPGGRQIAREAWKTAYAIRWIFVAMLAFTLSLSWVEVTWAEAFKALSKHGKLLLIPIIVGMIRTRQEALLAFACFGAAQIFLLASTWLLVAGIPIPWALSREHASMSSHAVFSSYLDQSIMTSIAAAVAWHLRDHMPGRQGKLIAIIAIIAAFICVFFIFKGRTGHVVAIAVISLASFWELPKRFRWAILLIAPLLLLILLAGSSKVRDRLEEVRVETLAFDHKDDVRTSTGIRLNLWQRSLQAMGERPLIGYGVGSWEMQYNRMQKKSFPEHQPIKGNPHQEYLLWGVELGVVGIALILSIFIAIYKDATGMLAPHRRALLSVLLGLALACLFNCSLYDALIGDFFCLTLGLLLALGLRPGSNTSDEHGKHHPSSPNTQALTA